jgi:hypothetical protein
MEQALRGELGRASLPARAALPVLDSFRPLQTLVRTSPTESPQPVASYTRISNERVRS